MGLGTGDQFGIDNVCFEWVPAGLAGGVVAARDIPGWVAEDGQRVKHVFADL